MGFNYWAWVGNVLGTTSTTAANGWVYSINSAPTGPVKTMWLSGWTGSEWSTNPDVNLNGATHSYLFKHGNYDYVNGSIVDWTAGYSHALPNSFYLSSAPSYFGASGTHCTYAWPWVTPTGGSQIQTPTGSGCSATDGLPAKARWAAGTPFVQP